VYGDQPFYATSAFVYMENPSWTVQLYQALVSLPLGQLDWRQAGFLDNEPDDVGESLDLAFIGNKPAVCYYDAGTQSLKLAVSKVSGPIQEDWVINTVASGPGVGQSCALTAYRGLPALLYWDEPAQTIRFARGI
jgi:hypothetical protein